MQKKLIALAIAAGFSGVALAQSNVTVYGQMNLAYEKRSSNLVSGTNPGSQSLMTNLDSRLGFKGEENLGGGIKAVFTQEFGVQADSNGMTTANSSAVGATAATTAQSGLGASSRQTFVGLSGNFGTITLGRQYTPYFEAAAAIDPFGASTTNVGSTATLHPIAAIARSNNSFKYVGKFGDIIVAGLMGLGEQAATAPAAAQAIDPKVTNFKIAYVSGPILVGLTTIKLSDNVAGAAGARGDWTKGTAFGGTYDFKVAKVHFLNDRVKAEAAGATAADLNIWLLGATVPMGAHTIKFAYNNLDNRLTGATANDSKHYGLGYDYAMSKRTKLFANYGNVSNSGAAANSVLGSTYKTSLQLGMGHSF